MYEILDELKIEATKLGRILSLSKSHVQCALKASATENCYTSLRTVTKTYKKDICELCGQHSQIPQAPAPDTDDLVHFAHKPNLPQHSTQPGNGS